MIKKGVITVLLVFSSFLFLTTANAEVTTETLKEACDAEELTCDFEKINYNHLFELTFYYILSDENASIVRDNKGSVNLQIQGFLHPYSNIWWKPDFLKIRAKLCPIFARVYLKTQKRPKKC